MSATPVAIDRLGRDIIITWNDGQQRRYSPAALRQYCPCALCKEKARAAATSLQAKMLPVLSLAETRPLEIIGMQPVGNYAYNIHFSDGHNSGIFEFQTLAQMGEPN